MSYYKGQSCSTGGVLQANSTHWQVLFGMQCLKKLSQHLTFKIQKISPKIQISSLYRNIRDFSNTGSAFI